MKRKQAANLKQALDRLQAVGQFIPKAYDPNKALSELFPMPTNPLLAIEFSADTGEPALVMIGDAMQGVTIRSVMRIEVAINELRHLLADWLLNYIYDGESDGISIHRTKRDLEILADVIDFRHYGI